MYSRGEIDEAQIPVEILDSWMSGEKTKNIIRPNRATYDAMWWFFDFDPHFDEPYDSKNYNLAVNNKAWRLSIVYGLDRNKAMVSYDPYNPEQYMMNTITPPNFVAIDGKDFTVTGELKAVTNQKWFQSDQALKYKDQAIKELTELGARFPVVIPYYYRVDQANQDLVAQVVEQQLEGLLGKDYIDIVPIAGPANNYLAEVRKAGKYGLIEEGWGPDYADPSTYAEPWGLSWSYNNRSMNTQKEYLTGYVYTQKDYDDGVIDDPKYVGAAQQIYDKMVQEAKSEKIDLAKRYELFAKAEAWLINEGIVIPFRVFSNGYVASKLTVFDGQYSSFGVSVWRYKGKHLLKDAMGLEEFQTQFARWESDRAAALAAAK
jgi:oligopeptide transport system substrate-binding protein